MGNRSRADVLSGESQKRAIRLVVSYDGANLCGWQSQPETRTAQGVVEKALAEMTSEEIRVRGASRTDSGVHAAGQIASFDTDKPYPLKAWVLGLNQRMPDDVAIISASEGTPGENPRFLARMKTYRYRLLVDVARRPLERARAWHLRSSLDTEGTMPREFELARARRVAALFVGTHDFRAYRSADDVRPNTVRAIESVEVQVSAPVIEVVVRGKGFMKNMVRIMVGTIVDAAHGRFTESEVAASLLETATRESSGQTAPAHGLTLEHIELGDPTPWPPRE